MASWNQLDGRFGGLGNASASPFPFHSHYFLYLISFLGVNELLREIKVLGDQVMDTLAIARTLQEEFDRRQARLGDIMTRLGYGYGGPAGVAHASEIVDHQREEYGEYWEAGQLALPPRPGRVRSYPSPPLRRAWKRQAHAPYLQLDEANVSDDEERDGADASDGECDGSEVEVLEPEEDDNRLPPSPPPHFDDIL